MPSEKGAIEQAAELTRSWIAYIGELRAAAPGIRWGIRATLSRSSGLYLVSMLSLSVALIAIRVVVAEVALDGRRVSALERLFDLRQEPMRNEDKPVLAATILGTAVDWTLCSAELREGRTVPADAGSPGPTSEMPTHVEILRVLDAAALLFQSEFTQPSSPELVNRAQSTIQSWQGDNRSFVQNSQQLTSAFIHYDDAGRGYTLVYPGISMRIPTLAIPEQKRVPEAQNALVQNELSELNSPPVANEPPPATRVPADASTSPPITSTLMQRLHGAIRRPSDALLGSFVGIVDGRRNDYAELRPQVQRFFFVSWNGIIQIYDARVHRLEAVQGSHVFSNAGYVTAALRASSVRVGARAGSTPSAIGSEGDPSESRCDIPSAFGMRRAVSRVYLDLLGSGAVATVCYPVRSEGADRIGGVFCADLSLPRRVIHGGAVEGRGLTGLLVDTERSTLGDDGEYQFRASDGAPIDMDRCTDGQAASGSDAGASCPRRAVRTWADRRRADRSAIDPIRGENDVDEFVAITWKGRIGNHRLIDVTVATSPRSKTRLWLSMAVALGFGIFSVALVVVRRQQDDEQLRLAIIEGLHVGVLISCPEVQRSRRAVDEGELAVLADDDSYGALEHREIRIESHDSRILTMNDRAEELFWIDRRPSWKAGVTWWSSLIMRHPADPSVLVCFDEKFRLLTFGQIAKLRSKGQASTYYVAARYAPLSHGVPKVWIQVSGSIALPSKTTFAVIEEVLPDSDTFKRLGEAFNSITASRRTHSEDCS